MRDSPRGEGGVTYLVCPEDQHEGIHQRGQVVDLGEQGGPVGEVRAHRLQPQEQPVVTAHGVLSVHQSVGGVGASEGDGRQLRRVLGQSQQQTPEHRAVPRGKVGGMITVSVRASARAYEVR